MTCAILVPIYKQYQFLDTSEKLSFNNLIHVFKSRDIILLTHEGINISSYISSIFPKYREFAVEYFKKEYFASTITYNELLLSQEFYKRFLNYDYILIYQLDAYVFEDRLEYWMSKEYDYVGAPWFRNFGSYECGNELWEVGNGGLSLRRVSFYYNLLTYKGLMRLGVDVNHGFYKLIKSLLMCLGYHNTISWYISYAKSNINEDIFLSYYLKEITNKSELIPCIPSAEEAIDFAFEKSPSYLFEMNNHKLPMGCHAFMKYEYEEFWSKYIPL